jgi:catalase
MMAKKRNSAKSTGSALPLAEGGENHQTAGNGWPPMTTQQGTPVADDQNSLKLGSRGPTLMDDFHFREKICIPTPRTALRLE